MSSADGAKPVFGILPISFGGTGVTTLQELKDLVAPESVMLFDYDANTARSIQLSDSAANYKMLQIIAKTNDGNLVSVDVYEPNGKSFSLTSGIAKEADDRIWFKTSSWRISGNSITYVQSGEHEDNAGQTNYGKDSSNKPLFLITQVLGYKKANSVQLPGDSPTPASDYNQLINKPTITEADLGVSGSGSNRTFGPIGTSTTVTIQGDNDQAGYQDMPFTTTEIDVIIAMAERAGAI